ncbi:MAG TPA: UbiD family decarboxylase [Rugosimonospora sp.]|jgi:UbiD family decarboxylase
MDVIDEQQTRPQESLDLDRFRLRAFIEGLIGTDELQVVDEQVDLADIAEVFEGNPRAVLLRRVGPEGAELVGGVAGSRARLARAFGVTQGGLLSEVLRRLRNTPEIVEVSREEAPVQQTVLTGADIDVTALPVHLQHGLDGAPYISASVDYVLDPKTGWTNVGMRRLMLRGRQETGIDLVSPSDLRAIYEASASTGKPLPVSFVVGSHPIDQVAATMRLPVNELGLVAALRDAPLPVVRCVTNDIRVPADAEWVLEGYLDERGHVESEGPYGEFLGYYGAVKRNPVFHLTAITHRRDALFQTATIGGRGMKYTDTAMLSGLRTEVMVWRALETAVREPLAVCATSSSGGMFNVRIALRQRVPGEARNAILATFGCLANVKNVFVVDSDVDVFSDEQIDWALATRFQADRDLIVDSGLRALPLDPSLTAGSRIGAKAGFDLTWPFGAGERIETMVPEPPTYDGERFASVRDAVADGPKYFAELMAAVGSRDGREIVRELDTLRAAPGLERDGTGRYALAPTHAADPQ